MAPVQSPEATKAKHDKKEKKDKSARKRARDEEAAADTERSPKKSRSVADAQVATEHSQEGDQEEKKKKKKDKKKKKEKHGDEAPDDDGLGKKEKKKKKKHHDAAAAEPEESAPPVNTQEPTPKKKKSKHAKTAGEATDVLEDDKEGKKKKKKSKKHRDDEAAAEQAETAAPVSDAMDIDTDLTQPTKTTSPAKIHQPSDIPANPQFPFFDQTVSLYEPLYPNGWANPITGCESQHLRHLKNRYVPSLRGVLLDYSNITLGPSAGRAGAAADDESPATLKARGEFAGGFGWITADVKLFVPSRGAWMEGSVNLQTEGHIGVVCFGRFNASVEARRLPSSWKWVPSELGPDGAAFDDAGSVITAPDEHGVVRQIHSTGYWVDGRGEKVSGRVRFRIRNFDVGVSGDSTYLSLQGTMLDGKAERKLVEAEAREARERRERKGGRWRERRTVPDFSMTKFDTAEEEQDDGQAQLKTFSEEADAAAAKGEE